MRSIKEIKDSRARSIAKFNLLAEQNIDIREDYTHRFDFIVSSKQRPSASCAIEVKHVSGGKKDITRRFHTFRENTVKKNISPVMIMYIDETSMDKGFFEVIAGARKIQDLEPIKSTNIRRALKKIFG